MQWDFLLILVLMAFLPAIIYVIWIRNTEKFNKEKWKPIFFCFFWGATIAVIASIALEIGLGIPIVMTSQNHETYVFLMAVIVAPFAEELTKPIALRFNIVKRELDELEDGLIYGAVAGLGFAATENLFYGYNAIVSQGFWYFFILISLRSVVGCLLHASATAWTGYGYGKKVMKHTSLVRVLPYFLMAIIVHAFYNALLSFDVLGLAIGLFGALVFTIFSMSIVRSMIRTLDKQTN